MVEEYKRVLAKGEMRNFITSACPAACRLIQMYYPKALPFLAPVDSPMTAHAKMMRKNDPELKVVFIGPCLAKKREADEHGIDGVLTFDECAHVLRSVARALAFAHENGVLHLDIKPANILIDRAGTVKLGDFGMATLASAAGYGGARGGTVGYMPPEQIDGGIVDEHTDIFALSVVVWQSLTGSCPFMDDRSSAAAR